MARICELGTACGIGTAWIESGMRPGATLFTVEHDAGRAGIASAAFVDNPAIEVVHGDWRLALKREAFDMLFSDSGVKRAPGDPERLLPLLNAGGLLVLDDFTPGRRNDPVQEMWLSDPAYRAVEMTLTDASAVILAMKRAAAGPSARRGSRSALSRG
jgi:predicted O-methyltransferase YrrM